MSKQTINKYYTRLDQYKRFGGTRNESSIRRAFANLLEEYCLPKKLILVDEVLLKKSQKHPDGTVRDALQLDWGHWESKDSKDNLDEEINKKFELGYPNFNILFENSEEIILIQHGKEVLRGNMCDADFLHSILTAFIGYERPEIKEFHLAVEKFKEDIPDIIEALRSMIAEQAKTNLEFKHARKKFWDLCKECVNPEITSFDIREMLIQHILTHEIFTTIFEDAEFHRENNIAKELQRVVDTFFTKGVRKNTLAKIDNYYKTIKREAANIGNHHEKQQFLKVIYENFYKTYNPKGADRLGIFYTPNEIVKFMIESTDYLLERHFEKSLSDKNVEILDPATGTGTFITDIIEHIPPQYLEYKYKNEIHANEVAILPYYIANLNIEYTYMQKMNKYEPFHNIVFVDTLDNLGFSFAAKQHTLFSLSAENLERIKKQNKRKISVIIGNPPYNANQTNENENNKNREYPRIDKLIKNTYVKESTAQKTKVYDMYSRFLRWASNRIDENGIIAFITNRSYIDSRTFDGFRKTLSKEFDNIYIVDTQSDVRKNPKIAGTTHNVFGIQTGVAVMFLQKTEENKKKYAKIHYFTLTDEMLKREKLEWFRDNIFTNISFDTINPDKHNNWINIVDNDFNKLIPMIGKKAFFNFYSLGVSTNRDEWVLDYSKNELEIKTSFFVDEYNKQLNVKKKINKENINNKIDYTIKWSEKLKYNFLKRTKLIFNHNFIIKYNSRPFIKKYYYSDRLLSDRLTSNHVNLFCKDLLSKNYVITFSGVGASKYFSVLGVNGLFSLDFLEKTQCLPLYRYDKDGNRIDNITEWGLRQFKEHYKNDKITKEDIFNYTYGVLHNPAYRKKYEINLKREFPRMPFYKDFYKWVKWGKQLMDLHINYEKVEPYNLKIHEVKKQKKTPKTILRATFHNEEIILDKNTSILGIPAKAWQYKLGNRSALHWILDQYKEKKPRDETIAEKFNTYRFADYKETVIDLLKRVCTVSVKTVEIVEQMAKER